MYILHCEAFPHQTFFHLRAFLAPSSGRAIFLIFSARRTENQADKKKEKKKKKKESM
jgi:hypothetical protein